MYIHDIHIIYYVLIGIVGFVVGQLVDWCNIRLPEYKAIVSKEFFTIYLKNRKANYIVMVTMAILYMALLYFVGSQSNIIYKIDFLQYMVLAPMLLSAFFIDGKLQIIPNRLNLSILEIGLVVTFIKGIFNIPVAMDMLLGAIVGAIIFLAITLLGKLFAGKEAMGLGDVKLMGALGLFFGWRKIIAISLIAFLLAAVISIILLITKKKKKEEYIPFGPFIVLASFIVMLVPFDMVLICLLKIFTLGMYQTVV